jgi:hypothetical protein
MLAQLHQEQPNIVSQELYYGLAGHFYSARVSLYKRLLLDNYRCRIKMY